MSTSEIIAARQLAATAYPEFLVDTKGRQHRCIPREAILAGAYDKGHIVIRHMTPAGIPDTTQDGRA